MEVNGQTEMSPKELNIFDKKSVLKFREYKAASKEEYETRLNASHTWKLSEEAARIGLAGRFSADRRRLIRALVQEFVKDKAKYDLIIGTHNIKENQEEKSKQEKIYEMFSFMRR